MTLNARSLSNLKGVHPDLVAVVKGADLIVESWDNGIGFIVTEGLRTTVRQAALVKAGASKTMNSKHLTGRAVDLAATINNEVRWDWPLYGILAQAMKDSAEDLGIVIEWGGDWKTFKDGPHFQLSDSRKA